jgi:hypothetical protein
MGDEYQVPSPNIDNDEILSSTSSSSSFVPIELLNEAVQIINENKEFNTNIMTYINQVTPASIVGNNYHVISVFGSQSTGKSTLLNALFNTNFDTMNESKRQQTTKGIWMAYSPLVSTTQIQPKHGENIFVMDVEGTDGRERGEDQDFERKAALFALSTSEILILNIWQTQVGLYHGANMGLLRTVFEVNLSLFGKSKLESNNDHKVLLLIVIRDHVGTPKESLAETITTDLKTMWSNLKKPAELEHLQFADFFDIDFHALPHKVFQPNEFIENVNELGDRLVVTKELFKPNYHHSIPIDGWTMYAENCWDQIDNNKDLDLPTQQILVAQFKCDEISSTVYDEFAAKYVEISQAHQPAPETDHQELGLYLADLKRDILENYDLAASRYNETVYRQKRLALEKKLNDKLRELFDAHAKYLLDVSIQQFVKDLVGLKGKNFNIAVKELSHELKNHFSRKVASLSVENAFEYNNYEQSLNTKIREIVVKQQGVELNKIVEKSLKKVATGMTKGIQFEMSDPSEQFWDNVMSKFHSLSEEVMGKYETEGSIDFGLGTDSHQNESVRDSFKFRSWSTLHDIIHKLINKDTVTTLMLDRFEDKFRYDENGLPRLYQTASEVESSYVASKEYGSKVLSILTFAKYGADGCEVLPEQDIFDSKLRAKYLRSKSSAGQESDEEESDDEEAKCFAEIVSEHEKAQIVSKYKKETDARYVEAKRAIIQHVTQIPYYIYLVIAVLGWNEFIAVIRNPFFFSMLILLGAGVYVLYAMNLLKPAIAVVQRLIEEMVVMAKEKLREIIVDDHGIHARNLEKILKEKQEGELIEMEEL